MKKKVKEFEFQSYLKEQKIKKKDLPKRLAKMIKIFEKHQKEVQDNCEHGDCLSIYSQVQKFADFIMNEIFEFVEENTVVAVEELQEEIHDENQEEQVEEQVEEEAVEEQITDEDILAEFYANKQFEVTRKNLTDNGFKTPINGNALQIGAYKLQRPLMHSMWIISKVIKRED